MILTTAYLGRAGFESIKFSSFGDIHTYKKRVK